MSAAVTNDLSIVYGSTTIGGTSDYLIVGPMRLEWGNSNGGSFRKAVVACTVLVTGTPYATFVANRQALELAFSSSRGRLQVILGGTTHIDLDPAANKNSGFNHTPYLKDLGSDWDTGSSRAYELRIEVDLPSTDTNALADFAVDLSFSPAGRRRAVFTGTYTSPGGNSTKARDQYLAKIDAQANTFLDELTASPLSGQSGHAIFEVVEDDVKVDYLDTIATFRRVYQEVIANQASGVLNDAEIVQQTLTIDRKNAGPGDSDGPLLVPGSSFGTGGSQEKPSIGTPQRAQELTLNYEAYLATTNALQARWTSKIQPFLLSTLAAYAGSGSLAVVEIAPRFSPDDNRVTATVRALAFGSTLISLTIEVDDDQDFGVVIDPVWGDPYEAEVSQVTARYTRQVTRASDSIGPVKLLDEAGLSLPPKASNDGWISLGRKRRTTRKKVGLASTGKQVTITQTVDVELLRFVKLPKGSSPNKPDGGRTVDKGVQAPQSLKQGQQSSSSKTPNAP